MEVLPDIKASLNGVMLEFTSNDNNEIVLKDKEMSAWFAENANETVFRITKDKNNREVLQMKFPTAASQALFMLKWQ